MQDWQPYLVDSSSCYMCDSHTCSKRKDQPGKVTSPARGQLNSIVIKDSKGKDQPGKVVNPACGQLNRENKIFPVPVRA